MREETIADIVAEMRTRSREVKEAFGGGPDGVENMLDIWADRIEALAKRDAAIHVMTCEAKERLREHLEIALEDNEKPVGSSAAMRDALNEIDRVVWDKKRHTKEETEAHRLATEALSAPARNCDKMPDIDNLTMHDLAKSPCKSTLEYASREELLALVRWLLALETEQEGVSC